MEELCFYILGVVLGIILISMICIVFEIFFNTKSKKTILKEEEEFSKYQEKMRRFLESNLIKDDGGIILNSLHTPTRNEKEKE